MAIAVCTAEESPCLRLITSSQRRRIGAHYCEVAAARSMATIGEGTAAVAGARAAVVGIILRIDASPVAHVKPGRTHT